MTIKVIKKSNSRSRLATKRVDKKKQEYDEIMSDFIVFCEKFVKIVDNYGDTIPFVLNSEQRDFVLNMSKYNMILKSRQIGFSTSSLAYCLWQAVKKSNTSYLIVSLDNKQVTELFNRLKFMYDNLPIEQYSYFPNSIKDNRDELVLSNGSRIIVSVPNENAGRGSTLTYAHISEMAFFDLDQSKLLKSVTQSLAKNNESKLVIESTANGTGNYYYDLYSKSEKGNVNYKAFFYGWVSDAHKKQFKAEIDQAVEWYIATNKNKRLSEKDLTTEDMKRLYKAGASLNMLMWREWKLTTMSLEDFQTEYPSTSTEAFKTSGRNVFDQGKIIDRLNYIPQPIDTSTLRKAIPVTLHKWIGKGLSIYHLPKTGRYYGGSDVASGSGGDSSSLTILDRDGVEVASFNSNKISVYEFAEFLNEIGRFYGYAYLAIERNSFGLPVIQRLRENYQYMNLYKHKTFDKKGNRKLELGWLTTESSKSILISDLKEQFERGFILINNKDTLQQMQMFVEDKSGKMGNKKGSSNHDDLVISLGLVVQAMKNGKWYV